MLRLRKRCCRGRSANPMSIQLNCARRSRMRQKAKRADILSRAKTSTDTTQISRGRARYSRLTTLPISTAARRRDTRCCAIRASRRWWCASASRRIGVRKAGPPDAGRSARPISNAAPMPHWRIKMSNFSELKRRNVIRMAGLYLVGAWLLVQVAGTVLPMFGAPEWLPRSVVILLALGFLPALIFSWVFELTPEGLKRDADVKPEESIAPQTARRMNRTIIVVLMLALAYFAFDKFVLTPKRNAALVAAASTPMADAHSLAVLPFVNMSGDAANEYFSDGISEEILNVLARTPELRVAARTSSFSFKGKTQEIPAIARELNVRMVLEGSVRKQDDRVRITAQLIDAKNGFHVWSETYDRKLQDIFAIQDEIAKAIGNELEVKLVRPAEKGKTSAGTRNLAAYDLYLRGIALWQTRRGDALWQALDLL